MVIRRVDDRGLFGRNFGPQLFDDLPRQARARRANRLSPAYAAALDREANWLAGLRGPKYLRARDRPRSSHTRLKRGFGGESGTRTRHIGQLLGLAASYRITRRMSL